MTRVGTSGTESLSPITDVKVDADPWPAATWVGEVDEAQLSPNGRLSLVDGEGFSRARLLIWSDNQPRGFAEVRVTAGKVEIDDLTAEAALLPPIKARRADWNLPEMTVAICTKDRPDQLRDALANVAELDYPGFDILVVDNNPASGVTAAVVEQFRSTVDIPVRTVNAFGEGLSIARNIAVRNALSEIVAFTDDDVVVDPRWLRNIAYGFGRGERVACVCGMVPSAELVTPAQGYFDRRVGWARRCDPALYDLATPPPDNPLFPMRVAEFGTGANFAVRRDELVKLGGFDEGLGIGSPTGGGEDIDVFVRFLLAGHQLVREPSAVVWHRHRRTAVELETQVYNYGLGLGAWIAKIGMHPRTLAMAIQRVGPAVKHLREVTIVDQQVNGPPDPEMEALHGRELRGVFRGPWALLSSRLAGRNGRPLTNRSSKLLRAFDFRRDQNWGDPGNSILAGRLALAAVVLGLIGSLGAISALPTFVLAPAVGSFVLAGPGSLAMSWYSHIPSAVLFPVLPAVSLATCLIVVSGLLMLGFYSPVVVLLGMTAIVTLGGLARCGYLARRPEMSAA